MWPTVHRPAGCKQRSPRCSIKCPQGNGGAVRHRRRRVPRRSGGWSTRCAYVGFLGLLGSEDARTAGGRCARPSPAWARWRRGDSAGNLTRAGRGSAKGDGVRGGVHARQATHAGAQGWGRDGGVMAAFTAEPGSTPWVAASAAPVVGWRVRDGVHGVVFRATKNAAFLPLATVCASYMATARSQRCGRPVHGGEHGEHDGGTKKGPKARPCLQGYGARVLGSTLASAVAHTGARADTHATRTRRGRTDTARRRPNGGGVLRQEGGG
jgi:hypothetical protein